MKKVLFCAGFGAVLMLAGCTSHTYTVAGGGWQARLVDGTQIERVSCDYNNRTLTAAGIVSYNGPQKVLAVDKSTISCNNDLKQLEWTVHTGNTAQ